MFGVIVFFLCVVEELGSNDAGNSVLLTEKHLSRGDWEDALDHKS